MQYLIHVLTYEFDMFAGTENEMCDSRNRDVSFLESNCLYGRLHGVSTCTIMLQLWHVMRAIAVLFALQ